VAKCQTEISTDGFEAIRLFNSCMSVSVMPQLGGKIFDLVDLKTGRDWLWKNPHIALRHPEPELDYEGAFDSGGWDEILFSVKPSKLELCSGTSVSIGDHGTLVNKAWKQSSAKVNANGEAVCKLYAEGQYPHFRLDRKITLDAERPQIRMEYTLVNTGESAWPWYWCAHPLLAIETGMQIILKQGQQIRLVKDGETESVSDVTWPMIPLSESGQIDLMRVFEEDANPETFCQKLFVRSCGQVSLSAADGSESFKMIYDPESLPWLGLWINKNGWSGCGSKPYLNLGLEPATAPYDKLADAVASDQTRLLEPGKTISWSLSIILDNGLDT
jgi:galactose mutarotase-like enzyme